MTAPPGAEQFVNVRKFQPAALDGGERVPFPDEEPATVPSLAIFRADSLAGCSVPPRTWHVQDLIPACTVTILNGDGGTGKSLLGQQLGVATALGANWLGLSVQHGPCLFITAEDDKDELHRRLDDIARETGEKLETLTELHIVSLAGQDALLAVPVGNSNVLRATPLFAAVKAAVEEIKPALVILDTLADLFGGEENQRAQGRQFVGLLRGLAIQNQCSVLLLAHPSLSGMSSGSGTSGSTAWNNSVRSRLYLERVKGEDGSEADPDARVLKVMKANYSRTGAEIRLRWQHGIFVTTAPTTVGLGTFALIAAQHKADAVFLDLLAAYEAEKRNVSVQGPNFAPAIFAADARSQGINKRALKDAMNRLFEAKRIKTVEFGPPSRRQKHITITPEQSDD